MPPPTSEVAGAAKFGRVRNNLKMGIVGLPNVGKSSLFNLLTDQAIAAENFPFCTIEPNEARCAVPDERYDYLCNLWKPASEYPALARHRHRGPTTTTAPRRAPGWETPSSPTSRGGHHAHSDCMPLRERGGIHVDDSVDPVRDLETIQHELCAKDMEYLRRAVDQEKLDVKKNPTMKLSGLFAETMDKVRPMLGPVRPSAAGRGPRRRWR